MDIDDILASITGPAQSQEPQDLQALTRAWVAERTAPELLPYPTALIERTNERISKQINRIEDLTSAMDPTSNFALVVIQTELERVKFIMRSLLRSRIAKIDRYPHHYLSLARAESEQHEQRHAANESQNSDDTTSEGMGEAREGAERTAAAARGGREAPTPLLSATEQRYAQHHTALLSSHYASSFLGAFPPALQRMDDAAGGVSMVEAPDADAAVFVRVLRDVPGVVEVHGEQGTGEIELRRGDVWVLRWSAVRDGVRSGDLELI